VFDSDALDALVDALAEPESRLQAAARLAATLRCEEILLLVRDPETRAFVPAAGMPKTLRGGPQWRRFLAECVRPGSHEGAVDLPAPALRNAFGISTGSSLAVAFGGSPDANGLRLLGRRMPLLGALLLSQHGRRQQEAEVEMAREGAARAHSLASALDAARLSASELNAKLHEETQRKDEFLAMLAHELRNPLAPLINSVELLRRAKPADAHVVQRAVDVMSRQLSQLNRLVNDLLDVSRVSRGAITLEREALALAEILQAAVETVAPLVEAKRHRLVVRDSECPAHVMGDRARLIQVFANLLSNAAKYTESGGLITVDVVVDGGRASVALRDNGAGIPPEKLGSVFELFSQVQATLHRSEGGLGIGLTLARTLVELHGGSIAAHSAGLGRGSTFVVSLPESRPPPDKADRPCLAATPRLEARRARVLVVEDNVDGAATTQELLLHMNAEVRVAASGEEALAAAQAFAPELILLDIGLPGMSGYEAASRLRSMLGESARLVALTGYGSPDDQARAREAGFDEHLVKPASLDVLQRLLTRAPLGLL
jgi:signal transduction histidine kinase